MSRIDRTKSTEKSKPRRKSKSMKICFRARNLKIPKQAYRIESKKSTPKPKKELKKWI